MLGKLRVGSVLALVTVFSLALSACAPEASQPAPAEQPADQSAPAAPAESMDTPKQGGIYVRSAGQNNYAGLDPAMGQMSYQVWPFIGLMMLRYEPETWNIVGDGIESWDFSDDGLELTLHVRKGMKFPDVPPVDGREVEARDVVYSLRGMTGQLYPELPPVRFPRRSNVEAMEDAVVVDKHTVKITLSRPSSDFIPGLAEYRSAHILPDGLREHFGDIQSLAAPSVERYISAGPFRLTKFTQAIQADYERNPDYWREGMPYLDGIKELWIPDRSTELAAFIANQIDYVSPRGDEDREFVLSNREDAVVVNYAPPSCWYRIAFNTREKPFDDVRVRKAIALVLNPIEAGRQARGEWEGQPLWKYPGPLAWSFPEALPQEELKAKQLYQGPTPENVAEAKRLLEEAGYGDGFEFELFGSKLSVTEYGVVAAAQIQKSLPMIKIELAPVDNAINHQRTAKGDYQAQYYCYIHEATATAMLKTAYHTKGGRNFTGYSNPKMDQLLDQAEQELDADKQKALLREAQLLALEDVPYMPTFHNFGQAIIQPWVKGSRLGAATSDRAWFDELWFDGAPERKP